MQSVNKIFEEAVKNEFYIGLMNKVCRKNLSSVCTNDEIKSFIDYTIWQCVLKYKPEKGKAKFSSYLYKSAINNSARLYKKKKKNLATTYLHENIAIKRDFEKNQAMVEAFEILESIGEINEEYKKILEQKYILGMTNKEIGIANGYGKECARKKIKKALELCREIVYN